MKCKRDSYLAIIEAIKFTSEKLGVRMELSDVICSRSHMNDHCIQEECSFHKKEKKKVAVTCVHNSCRSQIAEALGKKLASDVSESYSVGTETKPKMDIQDSMDQVTIS